MFYILKKKKEIHEKYCSKMIQGESIRTYNFQNTYHLYSTKYWYDENKRKMSLSIDPQ